MIAHDLRSIGATALTILVVFSFPASCQEKQSRARAPVGPYRDTWESLKAHQYPTWFLDAKFGIYTHWGPVTVATEDAPSAMEWYGQQLYQEKHPAFACHRQKYGEQIAFGYKDIIPRFTRGFRVVDTGVSRDHREYAIPAQ